MAPDGSKPFSFGMAPKSLVFVTVLLASSPLFLLIVVPIAVHRLGRFLGWTLRKKTDGRRSQIVAVMNEEDEKFWRDNSGLKTSSSDEWEAVEGANLVEAGKDAKAQQDWDGIVGFFHPFWYVEQGLRMVAMCQRY